MVGALLIMSYVRLKETETKRKILEDEMNTMVQWMNLYQNNSFVNQTRLPLLCEKSGAILLVLVGLTAVWQSNEILVDLEIFKILYRSHC